MNKHVDKLRGHKFLTFFFLIVSFVGLYYAETYFDIPRIDVTSFNFYFMGFGVFLVLMLIWNFFHPKKDETGLTKTDFHEDKSSKKSK